MSIGKDTLHLLLSFGIRSLLQLCQQDLQPLQILVRHARQVRFLTLALIAAGVVFELPNPA